MFLSIQILVMKTNFTQQEILLVTGATFSQRELCRKGVSDNHKPLSKNDALEEACWNGLLHELLGNVIVKSAAGKELCLWQIRHGESFIEIDLCDSPAQTDNYLSVDPYAFLPTLFIN